MWFKSSFQRKELPKKPKKSRPNLKKLRKVQAKTKTLEDQLDEAQTQQTLGQNEAQAMADKITCATDLVACIGDEGKRWKQKIADYKEKAIESVNFILARLQNESLFTMVF